MDSNRTLFQDLSNADLDLIDAILDRFEAEQAPPQLDTGKFVDFSTWLEEAPENLRGDLLQELIVLSYTNKDIRSQDQNEKNQSKPSDVSSQEIDFDDAERQLKQQWPSFHAHIQSAFSSVRHEVHEWQVGPSSPGFPEEVGRFRIMREIGRGGMGVVYLGYDPTLRRAVALKVLLAAIHASPAIRQRFVQESETAARLQHENVVRVYEAGEHEGLPFIALEYIDGPHLGKFVDGQPQSAKQAALWVQSLAGAVQAAHEAGIVHRDLKPSNVLVQDAVKLADASTIDHANDATAEQEQVVTESAQPQQDAKRTLKVTDFGLAKDMSAESDLTMSGAILGTAQFMAPEQAGGRTQEVGPPTDVYGLGAILYYLLTGRPPFLRSNSLETIKAVQYDEVLPPRTLVPTVPRDLETICLRCLQKSPTQRFDSAADLAEELGRFLDNRPILSRPIGPVLRAWRWCQNNSIVASLVACVFLVLTVGSATTSWQWWKAVKTNNSLIKTQDKLKEKTELAVQATRDAKAADLAARLERDNSQLREATLTLENALEQAQLGEVNEGLAWMMQALESVPVVESRQSAELREKIAALENAIRINLRSWAPYALQRLFTHQDELMVDQTGESLIWIQDKSIYSVDLSLESKPKHLIDLEYRPSRCWLDPEGRYLVSEVDFGENTLDVWHMHAWDLDSGEKLADINYSNIGSPVRECLFAGHDRVVCRIGATFRNWDLKQAELLADTRALDVGPIQLLGGGEFFTDYETIWEVDSLEKIPRDDARLAELSEELAKFSGVPRTHAELHSEGDLIAVQPSPTEWRMQNASTGKELISLPSARLGEFNDRTLRFAANRDSYFRLPSHYLRNDLARDEFAMQAGDQDRRIAFSQNGEVCAVAERNKIQLIDCLTGQTIGTPIYHPIQVQQIALSTDGKLVATAIQQIMSDDIGGTVVITNRNGERVAGPFRHTNHIGVLGFAPDGKTLLAGDFHGRVKRWDTSTGQEIKPFASLPEIPVSVKFTPDGRNLAIGTSDDRRQQGLVQFYDYASGMKELARAELPSAVELGDFTAYSKRIVALNDDEFQLLDVATGSAVTKWKTQSKISVWTQSGTAVAACTQPKEVAVYDLASEQMLGLPITMPQPAIVLALSANASYCAAATGSGAVHFWDTKTGIQLGPALQTWQDIVAIRYLSESDTFRIVTSRGKVFEWRIDEPIRGEHEELATQFALASGFRVDEQFLLKPVGLEEWPKLDSQRLPTLTAFRSPQENIQALRLAGLYRCALQGNYSAAIQKSKAIFDTTDHAILELRLALESGELSRADTILETAAESTAAQELAILLQNLAGQIPETEQKSRDWCFTHLLELLPENFELLTESADSLFDSDQLERANDQIRRASELCSDPLWLPWFVHDALSSGDRKAALEAYRKFAKLERQSTSHSQRFARLLVLEGETEEYQKLVQELLDGWILEYRDQAFLEIWRYSWVAGMTNVGPSDAARSLEIAERAWELGKDTRLETLAMTTKALALLRAEQFDVLEEYLSKRPLDSSNQMLPYQQLILAIGLAQEDRLPEARELFQSVSAPTDLKSIDRGELAVLYLEAQSLLPKQPKP